MFTVGIITVSDAGAKGESVEKARPAIEEVIAVLGWKVERYIVVPDDVDEIKEAIVEMTDDMRINLVLTTGGTGFAKRDITPEATLGVIEKRVQGIPEAIRAKSFQVNPDAMLSRLECGIRRQSLIVNLPGYPAGIKESLEVVLPIIANGLKILRED